MNHSHNVKSIAFVLALLVVPMQSFAFKYATEEEKRQQLIEEMDQNIEKVDAAIKLIQQQIEEARDAPYVPDLYFRLAELYVEKSRYHYIKKKEENPGQPVKISAAPAVLDAKQLAIDTYKGILKDYPDYRNNDKAHFFLAHEYKELGQTDDMLNEYRIITRSYKDSPHIGEAYLLLGNYHFDRRNLKAAKKNYSQVIKYKESKVINMARYKLGWVYINEDNDRAALAAFTDIARSGNTSATNAEDGGGLNIIREALIDSVITYTEVMKPVNAIEFYRELSDSEQTYIKVLSRLANRYYVRKQLGDAARLYRETLKLNPDLEEARTQLERLFEHTRKKGDIEQAAKDIELLVKHMSRYFHSWRVDEKDRLEAFQLFERSARDVATRLHSKARKIQRAALFHRTTKAYKQYLALFGDSKFAIEMQLNYAEALYSAGDYVKAGKEYEKIGENAEGKDKKEIINSAIFAYFEALKDPDKLTRVEVIDARRGFISSGKEFVKAYPKAKETPNLMFSIARSYYDLAEYDDAIKAFAEFIDKYPQHPKVPEAGHLALDSYHFKKDFEGMTKFGKGLLAKKGIGDAKFKGEVAEIIQQAEFKSIEKLAEMRGQISGAKGAEKFIQFARDYKGSGLGEKALYNAFITAKKSDNPNLVEKSGQEMITQFPKSEYLKDVYPTLGNMALNSGEFEQAAGFFEAYSEKFPQKRESSNLLYNAATIQRLLQNYRQAAENFSKVLRGGKRADAGEVRWQLALTYEEAGDWNSVNRELTALVNSGRASAEALYKLGEANREMGRGKTATNYYRKALGVFAKLPSRSRTQEELDAAAGARYRIMEGSYEQFRNIRVRSGIPEEKIVAQKTESLGRLEKESSEVSKYSSAKWSIASVYLVAQGYDHFANFLESTSIPSGLTAQEKAQYQQLLGNQVRQFKQKSLQTCRAAVATAHKANIFNDYVLSCLNGRLVQTPSQDRTRASLDSKENALREQYRLRLLKNPRDLQALHDLGMLYLEAGDHHLARLVFLRAIEVGSKDWRAFNGVGVALWYDGKHQEAYFQFLKAWQIAKSPVAAANLAGLYKFYGNRSASAAFQKRSGGLDKKLIRANVYIPPATGR